MASSIKTVAPPIKMVIDCDPGTDDAQAILMAVSQPHVTVVAITTVFGNAAVSNTSWNALRVLKVANRLDVSSLLIHRWQHYLKYVEGSETSIILH
jgi:hypothetical protein